MEDQKSYQQGRTTERDTDGGRNNLDQRGSESPDQTNEGGEPLKIYLDANTTLQTPEEHQHDQSVDPTKDDVIDVSMDDLHATKADRMAGSDRAGTSERKSNSMDSNDDELHDQNRSVDESRH
jgi:hypothetical protein